MRTNKQRVADAREALKPYNPDTEGVKTALIDLMTDLYHLAQAEGILMDDVRRIAYTHYSVEMNNTELAEG